MLSVLKQLKIRYELKINQLTAKQSKEGLTRNEQVTLANYREFIQEIKITSAIATR